MFSLFSAESSWYGSRQTTVHRKNVYNLTNELSICRQSYYTFERNYIFCINTYSLRRLLDQLALLLVRWEYHDQSLYICPCSYNYAQISCVNQLITAYLQLFCNAIDHSEFANRAMENFPSSKCQPQSTTGSGYSFKIFHFLLLLESHNVPSKQFYRHHHAY